MSVRDDAISTATPSYQTRGATRRLHLPTWTRPPRSETAPAPGPLVVRLDRTPDGHLRIDATGAQAHAEAIVSLPSLVDTSPGSTIGSAGDPWDQARRIGVALYQAVFPPAVRALLDASRRAGAAPVSIVLQTDDETVAALPWELMRDPKTGEFLALAERTLLSRAAPAGEPSEVGTLRAPEPEPGHLRVRVVSPVIDEEAARTVHALGEDPQVDLTVMASGVVAPAAAPHVVQVASPLAAGEELPPGLPVLVVEGDAGAALAAGERARAVVALPAGMPTEARTTFLARLYARLGAGEAVDRAVAAARRAVAERHTTVGLDWAGPTLVMHRPTGPLVVPEDDGTAVDDAASALTRLRGAVPGTVRSQMTNWCWKAVGKIASSVSGFVLGMAMVWLGLSASRGKFTLDVSSPEEGFTGLVLELSTRGENFLLGTGVFLLVATVVISVLWLRSQPRTEGEIPGPVRRLTGLFCSKNAVTWVAGLTLAVLCAYGYQQYLWRMKLPIPEGKLGIAFTQEAAAASFGGRLDMELQGQGYDDEVVHRTLPVRFDPEEAPDLAQAREMGERIGARAVIIYREDDQSAGGTKAYVAYVIFTDPNIGLVVGQDSGPGGPGDDSASNAQQFVRVKEGLEVAALRVEVPEDRPATADVVIGELVGAAAGILAYHDDRFRDAIHLLTPVVERDADGPNTGIANFYIGNAYNLIYEYEPAVAAYDRALAYYDRRGDALGPQDRLILVKTLVERGALAAGAGDWDLAIKLYRRGHDHHAMLTEFDDALERPAEVYTTYARLYAQLADAYRFKGDGDEEAYWRGLAEDQFDRLEQAQGGFNAGDARSLAEKGRARLLLGDCVGALGALNEALRLDPTDSEARLHAAVTYWSQSRLDLARPELERIIADHPNDVRARLELAWALRSLGIVTPNAHFTEVVVSEEDYGYYFFELAYVEQAEAVYREILRVDPNNVSAHEMLAALASWRGDGALSDLTAQFRGDDTALARSQRLWRQDPVHQQAARDAYMDAVDQQRQALDLRPDSSAARVALANMHNLRQLAYLSILAGQAQPTDKTQLQADGDQILEDHGRIVELTDQVLDERSKATREERLRAWVLRLDSLDNARVWYSFYTDDAAQKQAIEGQFRQAVAEAAAFAEAVPVAGVFEADALRDIYHYSGVVARELDQDHAAAIQADTKAAALEAEWAGRERDALKHGTTLCLEERERLAGETAYAEGDHRAAQDRYTAALTINPQHLGSRVSLSWVLYLQDDIAAAIIEGERAVALAPEEPMARLNLGLYHLVAGNADARDRAYTDAFAALRHLPPQERMTILHLAIKDLRDLVARKPEVAPRVREALPLVAVALDEMAAAGEGTFQYPQLYAALGAVALDIDGAGDAEPLLRRALDLDSHQPTAHVRLALAVAAQDRNAKTEIEAAIAETRHELWQSIEGAGPHAWLEEMAQAVQRYGERFPERRALIRGAEEAIADELERFSYTSPTYGYTLSWDDRWSVVQQTSDNGYDLLDLTSQVSPVRFEAYPAYGVDVAGCLDEAAAGYRRNPARTEFRLARDGDGRPLQHRDADTAYAAYTYGFTAEDGTTTESALYLECRALDDGEAMLQITQLHGSYDFTAELDALRTLTAQLVLSEP